MSTGHNNHFKCASHNNITDLFSFQMSIANPSFFQRIIGLISHKQAPVVGSVVISDIQYLIYAILAIQYLISQKQVPGGVFPFLQLLQVDIFDFPSGIFELICLLVFLAIPLSCHIISSILQSPLCLTLSITLGNKKLFSARVTVKASVYTKKLILTQLQKNTTN